MKLGEVVVIHVYCNFTKFRPNGMKNKKAWLTAHFSVQNFKVSVESWILYIVRYPCLGYPFRHYVSVHTLLLQCSEWWLKWFSFVLGIISINDSKYFVSALDPLQLLARPESKVQDCVKVQLQMTRVSFDLRCKENKKMYENFVKSFFISISQKKES